MELGVRDWMIIVGILLIVAVLLDGYRRMRNERRGNIRMALNKQFINASTAEEDSSSELPNGGARVVGRSDIRSLQRGMSSDHSPELGDGEIDLDQSVPMLMDSVIAAQAERQGSSSAARATQSRTGSDGNAEDQIVAATNNRSEDENAKSKSSPELDDQPSEPLDPLFDDVYANKKSTDHKKAAPHSGNEEVIVINVLAKNAVFKGPDLLHILLACDLRFGEMNIFHRHEQANGSGAVQFSMANSVVPGTFDLDKIEDFTTPAVSFFMSVPGPKEPIKAFECMLETAQCLVTNLEGELRDESRSALTNQTLEHYRQRLQEFERRQLTRHH